MLGYSALSEYAVGDATPLAPPVVLASKVVFSVVKDFAGTPADDVSGLDYAIYEALRLNANIPPIKVGNDLAIIGGIVTLNIAGVTTLNPGGMVRVSYGSADGGYVASAIVPVS